MSLGLMATRLSAGAARTGVLHVLDERMEALHVISGRSATPPTRGNTEAHEVQAVHAHEGCSEPRQQIKQHVQ